MDWVAMVRLHGPLVWRTVYRLVGNEADAADSFQETFLSALAFSRDREVTNWPGLLRRFATARGIECLRRRVRRDRDRRPFECDVNGLATSSSTPDRTAEANELADDLRAALAEIDPLQAEAFCLACLDAVPYREIADQLGITVNHVGVLIHRARAALRDRLRRHDPLRARESAS